MSRPPRWLVITPLLGALALGAAAAWFHFAERRFLQQTASATLRDVAQAKLDEIAAWLANELHDAAELQESPLFVRAVERWLTGRQPRVAADLLAQLRVSQIHAEDDDVRLVDRAGRVLLATSGRRGDLHAHEAAALRAAFRDRRPTMGDLRPSTDDSIPHLAIVAPLFPSSGRTSQPVGAVVHVVDPRRSLFRLVESWPGRSPSAEALLVRRDGDSVLILSAQRPHPGPALSRRVPLSRRDAPAVMAALGTEGIVRGVDYHGVRVIAALRAVPGTPWFLVVKVNEAEALAVWRTRTALVFGLLLAAVIVAGATAIVLGQRFATARYRRLYEAEAALGASEARFRTLMEEAGDGFALLDADGRYLDMNSACCRQLGYARAELLRLNIADIDPLFTPERCAADFQSLVDKPPSTYESVHRREDGTTFPVEVTLSIVRIGGVPQALSLARDITERKRAEDALRREQAMLARTESIAHVGSWEWDVATDTTTWSDELFRIFQRDPREGAPSFAEDPALYHPDDMARLRQAVEVAVAEGTPYELELRANRKDGETRVCVARGIAEMSPGGRAVRLRGSLQDITERTRAEAALRQSEARFKAQYRRNPTATFTWQKVGEDFALVDHNDAAEALTGAAPKAFVGRRASELYAERPEVLRDLERSHADGEVLTREAPSQHFLPGRHVVTTFASVPPDLVMVYLEDVTERKRAEEALRESEERFRLAIHATFNTVWDWNLETDALWWSENFQTLFGYRAEEIEPDIESWKNRIHPEDLDRVTAGIRAAIDSGRREWSDQYRFRRKDGSYAVVDDRGYIAHAANGIPKRMIGAIQDITERRRAEEALAQETALLAQAEAASHMGSWRMLLETGRVTWSDEMYNVFGVERSTSAPSGSEVIASRVHPEDRARLDELNALALRDGISLPVDYRIVRPDGTVRWVHGQGTQERDETGHVVALAGFVQDVTERRQAEATLRESEERYRSIIEQLNDAYYRTDREGRITMMSPSAAPLFGFPSISEMLGRPIESLWRDPGQRAALLAAIGERGFVRDYETTALRADGTTFAVAVSSHWVRDPSGAPDGVEGIIRDITDRQRAEAALRELARHLDSVREEEHTRIARQIHDELGQALTALRLDLTWVGRKIPKAHPALRRRIDAAVALTDETITVGQRIVAELRPPILDDLGLAPAVEWYTQHFAKRSGLLIEFDAGAEEPAVPDQLAVTAYRIMQEALTNVARHAEATHATVYLREQDGALTIEIRDDGRGLPEEAIRSPHSFGLVGMRERAATQGGELVITSAPGAGTTVRVTFLLERREDPRGPR